MFEVSSLANFARGIALKKHIKKSVLNYMDRWGLNGYLFITYLHTWTALNEHRLNTQTMKSSNQITSKIKSSNDYNSFLFVIKNGKYLCV